MEHKHPLFTHGVREDRTLDYTMIETRLAALDMLLFPRQHGYKVCEHEGKRWVEFTVDNGGTDLMVRLPSELVEQMAHNVREPLPDPEGSASSR